MINLTPDQYEFVMAFINAAIKKAKVDTYQNTIDITNRCQRLLDGGYKDVRALHAYRHGIGTVSEYITNARDAVLGDESDSPDLIVGKR